MVQVRGYTEDDVDVLADEFALVIQASLKRAVASAANQLSALTASGVDALTATSSAGLTPDAVSIVSQTWDAEVDGVLTPYVAEVYTGSATSVAIGLADGFPSDELAGIPLIADEFQLTFMKSVSGNFVDIGADVWEDCRTVLVEGIKNGESIEQIAAKMMHVTDFTANHAELVARTAVHSAAESGSIAQIRWMGYNDDEVEKEWLSTHDARTRPTHFHADKQQVPLSGKFTVGSTKLDFPGDPLGAADEVIRCRCTALFNIGTPPKFRCDGILTAAAQPDASQCVMPTPHVDISGIAEALREVIFTAFMKHKISPAYGGAKIHKVLAAVRAEHQAELAGVDDWQILAVVDYKKTGPGGTFTPKYAEWLQSPAGKKAVPLGLPKVTHVIAPIQDATETVAEGIFDASKALTYKPTPEIKYAQVMPVPAGQVTTIVPEWGGTQQFVGTWVRVYDPETGKTKYGSAYSEWIESNTEIADGHWQKTATVDAYMHHGPPMKYTTVLKNGTVETSKIANEGDWIVRQKNGEVQVLAPDQMQLRYDIGGPTPKVISLPPVKSKPTPQQLTFTGKTLGSHGAQVWVNPSTGERWLFKPQDQWMTDLDVGVAKIQSKASDMRPGMYEMELGGKKGSIQFMFESGEAWPHGSFDPLKLSSQELATLQQGQIFDWMMSNFDTHTGQWIRLKDGQLFGTDKGQAFKFFGKDKLDWDYVPVYPLGDDKLTYPTMWKAFVQGKDIDLQDPTTGELGAYIDRLMAIPDDEYAELLRPYAEWREQLFGDNAKAFLAKAVKRKNDLKKDFSAFWLRAQEERAKHLPKVAPKPPTPSVIAPGPSPPPAPAVPTAPLATSSTTGDISSFDYFFKSDVLDAWVELGAGKKVTPAWGGAKIWKLLGELKAKVTADILKSGVNVTDAAAFTPNELQLLRILDDIGGFTGKPKTYEGELLKWMDTPNGQKTVGLFPPPSLVKTTPAVKPVVKPTAIGDAIAQDEISVALSSADNKVSVNTLFVEVPKYSPGDVIAYVKTANGDTLRATASSQVGHIAVEVRKDSQGKTNWIFDDAFDDWFALQKEYNFADGLSEKWSLIPPPKPLIATKIPGKGPGDVVDHDEIAQSKYLWENGDVIAEAHQQNHDYRLVSLGEGSIRVEFKMTESNVWLAYKVYAPIAKIPKIIAGVKAPWKLQGGTIETKTASTLVSGKSPGDVLSVDELALYSTSSPIGKTFAYAYDPNSGAVYRMNFSFDGLYKIEYSTKTGAWLPAANGAQKGVLDLGVDVIWRLAKNDHSMPDQIKAMVAGKVTPGSVTQSKYLGVAVDEEISIDTLSLNTYKFDDWEILAFGKHPVTGGQYRVYRVNSDWYAVEYKLDDAWTLLDVVSSTKSLGLALHNFGLGNTKWYATALKASKNSDQGKKALAEAKAKSSTPMKKAAKKTAKSTPPQPTPAVPKTYTGTDTPLGVPIGTDVTQGDILAWQGPGQPLLDGQILAVHKTTGWDPQEYRIVYVNGFLVQQKKSKAGSWIGSKTIKYKWDIYGGSYTKWTASNELVSVPNLKALKKFTDKEGTPQKYAQPTGGGGVKSGPKPAATPAPAAPFKMRHIDLSAWSETEQEEIYQYFKSTGHVYISSNPESVWGAVQAVKSHFQTKYGGKYINLNELEILRIADSRSALKHGVTDTHPWESKVVNWLKTSGGKAYVNKKIDAPIAALDVPVPMIEIESSGIPLDQQTYAAVTNSKARDIRAADHAKYGAYTSQQKAKLREYTGGVYSSWNAAIRNGDLGPYASAIKLAQQGMRPSTRAMLLHRKVGWAEFNDPGVISYESILPYVGRTYVNRGFNSTATTDSVWSGQVHLEIEAPIGTPMAHVQDFSHHPSENETILAAHLIYQIISVKKKGSQTVVRVRVIGAATP